MATARVTDPADPPIGSLLADINRLARREFDRRVQRLKLTRAQWLFLFHLGREPGITQSELAELLQVEKITISRQAERLARAGWIRREDDAGDARAYRLQLTPKARRVIAELNAAADRLREDFLAGLSTSRRHALRADLLLIKGNLRRLLDRPPPPLS